MGKRVKKSARKTVKLMIRISNSVDNSLKMWSILSAEKSSEKKACHLFFAIFTLQSRWLVLAPGPYIWHFWLVVICFKNSHDSNTLLQVMGPRASYKLHLSPSLQASRGIHLKHVILDISLLFTQCGSPCVCVCPCVCVKVLGLIGYSLNLLIVLACLCPLHHRRRGFGSGEQQGLSLGGGLNQWWQSHDCFLFLTHKHTQALAAVFCNPTVLTHRKTYIQTEQVRLRCEKKRKWLKIANSL